MFPNTFTNVSSISELDLSCNQIQIFPVEQLSNIQPISTLYLQNNTMRSLPWTAYDMLSSISTVNIENNTWQCDCGMLPFRLRMNESHLFENQMTCSQPGNFDGQQLLDIQPRNLISDCEEPTILRFGRIENIPLVEGDTLHVFCEASGIPTPDITVILPSGLKTTVESGGEMNGTNTMTNVTASDAGLYVCIAVNAAGSTFATRVVDLQTAPTTVFIPSVTSTLATTSNIPESSSDLDSSMSSFSPPVSAFSSHSKLPEPAPTFSLSVLLGAICGSVAGTVLIGGIILAIWCKRCSKTPSKGPDFSVVFNNTNTTTTVITNNQTEHPQAMSESFNVRNPPHVPRPASSQFEPYEDVEPPPSNPRPRGAVPRQPAIRQALRPPNSCRNNTSSNDPPPLPPPNASNNEPPPLPPPNASNNEPPPLPPPNAPNNEPPPLPPFRTANAAVYENIPEHAYQPLTMTRNQPNNGNGTSNHYQSLRRT
ncbi:PXDN [Branchiostoma lanceolatum]|uniref:PXDN protein n=1 Tax=Branchiostoma lanceolatum TaxID=7740 RepID=A0A8J9YZ13_BRALA|nr:PXDN [Branchiostoma lanceolatum]